MGLFSYKNSIFASNFALIFLTISSHQLMSKEKTAPITYLQAEKLLERVLEKYSSESTLILAEWSQQLESYKNSVKSGTDASKKIEEYKKNHPKPHLTSLEKGISQTSINIKLSKGIAFCINLNRNSNLTGAGINPENVANIHLGEKVFKENFTNLFWDNKGNRHLEPESKNPVEAANIGCIALNKIGRFIISDIEGTQILP